MPPPWISNIGNQPPPPEPQQARGQESPADNLAKAKALGDTVRNFNDSPVGRILGSSRGSPVKSAPDWGPAPTAPAAEAGGEAAGAEAAGAATEAGGASALAELAPLAALA